MDKDLPVTFGPTFREGLRRYFSQPLFVMTMSVAFASLGLFLVSIGVYKRPLLRGLAADARDWDSYGAGRAAH